jgi:hypothetical protein
MSDDNIRQKLVEILSVHSLMPPTTGVISSVETPVWAFVDVLLSNVYNAIEKELCRI